MFSNNLTMMTDLYELTMMQGYFFEGNEDKVVFDVFTAKSIRQCLCHHLWT